MAHIKETNENSVHINYMAKKGKVYVWTDEDSFEPIENVLISIGSPKLENNRGHYSFSENELQNAEQLVKQKFKVKHVYFK